MDFDALTQKMCEDFACKKSELKNMLIKQKQLVEKYVSSPPNEAEVMRIVAELMGEASRLRSFTGQKKKDCVIFMTEKVLHATNIADIKIDEMRSMISDVIDGFAVLVRSKKNKMVDILLGCLSLRCQLFKKII